MIALLVLAGCAEQQDPEQVLVSAEYVGDEACTSCHADVYVSYHETGMGRSVSRFDPATAPEQFDENGRSPVVCHDASGYCYQAFIRNDSLFQREFRRDGIPHELVYPVSHVVGSGNATRSYFLTVGEENGSLDSGYVTEMPLTWYVEREIWDLSPGYSQGNSRFDRPIVSECMTCHNGMPEVDASAQNYYTHIPLGISCERCHGPASEHVEAQLSGGGVEDGPDPTIVNPARLTPDLELSVCQQCHLTGQTVFAPDHGPTTFRPGMALSDTRTVYASEEQVDNPESFGISSHALRMMQSECFTQTQGTDLALTCTTCHDPHQSADAQGVDHFNTACQSCHGSESHIQACTRPNVSSIEEAMNGNCVSCHMQRSGTSDIPHVLFTDHWIRADIPERSSSQTGTTTATIHEQTFRDTPFTLVDVTERERRLAGGSTHEVDRATADLRLGIAYFQLYDTEHRLDAYLPQVVRLIRSGLSQGATHPEARVVLGRALVRMDSLAAAEDVLTEAVSLDPEHPRAPYWLGDVRLRQGNVDGAVEVLRQAVEMSPQFSEARYKYAEALAQAGRTDEAIAQYQETVRRDPFRHTGAWNNLGFLFMQRQQWAQAQRALLRAVELDARFVEARANLGAVYFNQEQIDAASEQFRTVLEFNPDYIPALGNLGVISMQAGRTAEARRYFERLLSLSPGDQQAAAYLSELSN
ncbi:MAG: tetratricopeptide repeat protein [Rubricoccaceae bacterium]|nr:tetratricopeptide repeat protein [Rubricoccaceae bacterium]